MIINNTFSASLIQSNKNDKKICLYVVSYFVVHALNASIKSIFEIPISLWPIVSNFFGVLLVLIMLRAIYYVFKRSTIQFIYSFALFIILYSLSILFSIQRNEPYNLIINDSAFLTFSWWLSVGLFSYSVFDKKILYSYFLKASYVISFVWFIYFLVNINSVDSDLYNMTFGYSIILPLLIHLNEWLRNKNKYLLILFIFEIILIISLASRGVLLSLLFFILIRWYYSFKPNIVSLLKLFFAFIVLIVLYMNFIPIVNSLNDKLIDFNINSRTLQMILINAIDDDTGRVDLWKVSTDMILEKPFFGWGIGGEHYHLAKMLGSSEVTAAFTAHNGILEMMIYFGIPIGLLISTLLIFSIFTLRNQHNYYLKSLLLISYSIYIIPSVTIGGGILSLPGASLYVFLYLYHLKSINNNHKQVL